MEVIESKQAFLFSLVNPFGTEPVRIPVDEKESGCVIACKKSLGPSFGRDYWSEKYLHIEIQIQCEREIAITNGNLDKYRNKWTTLCISD